MILYIIHIIYYIILLYIIHILLYILYYYTIISYTILFFSSDLFSSSFPSFPLLPSSSVLLFCSSRLSSNHRILISFYTCRYLHILIYILLFYSSSHSKYTCRYLHILIYILSSKNLTPHVLSEGNVEWCRFY